LDDESNEPPEAEMLPLKGMTGVILAEIRAFIFSMSSHLPMICSVPQQIIRGRKGLPDA